MKKAYLITAILLLSSVWVVAQSSGSAQTPDTSSSQSQSTQSGNSSSTPSTASPSSTMPQSSSPSSASPSSSSPSSQTPDSSTRSTTTTQTTQTSSDSSGNSIEGCLAGSAGSYTLTDSATGKTFTLAGDTSKLGDHVGHQVRVMGTSGSGSDAASSGASSSASSGAGSGSGSTFNVKKVKMISSSCSTSK